MNIPKKTLEVFTLNNNQIIENLGLLLSAEQINTDREELYDASADRYKKYAKARRVLDVPLPLAIVYPKSAEEVSRLLVFCNENQINVIPRAGKSSILLSTEAWILTPYLLSQCPSQPIPAPISTMLSKSGQSRCRDPMLYKCHS